MHTSVCTCVSGEEYEPNARLIYEAQDFEEDLDEYFQEYLSDFTRFFENYDASPNMDELKKVGAGNLTVGVYADIMAFATVSICFSP
jgi:hypothetical protein